MVKKRKRRQQDHHSAAENHPRQQTSPASPEQESLLGDANAGVARSDKILDRALLLSSTGRRSLIWKLGVAIGIVLLAQVALWGVRQEFELQSASLARIDLAHWPLELPGWQGERTSLDDEVVRHSGADAMGTWLYQNRLGEQVLAHAGIWTKYETALPHPPELCYAGSGYRLLDRHQVMVTSVGRPPAKAMVYRFERQQMPLMVLAWYQFGEESILERNELRGLLQRVRSGSGVLPPAIKVMLQCRAEDPQRAEEQLLEVAGLLRAEAEPLQSAKLPDDTPRASKSSAPAPLANHR